MSLNTDNINDLKESINYIVQRNYEVQDEVKTAIKSEDYLKAIKIISNFLSFLDEFTTKAVNIEQYYKNNANYKNASICNKIVMMANHIKIAHLEVEENILRKYRKK